VDVVTGNVNRGGTDANVFLTMYGENGDSGERQLSKSETNRDKFERGQVRLANDKSDLKANTGFCRTWSYYIRVDSESVTRKTVLDRGSRSDAPRYCITTARKTSEPLIPKGSGLVELVEENRRGTS